MLAQIIIFVSVAIATGLVMLPLVLTPRPTTAADWVVTVVWTILSIFLVSAGALVFVSWRTS